jgi:methionyl-tRNA synthetase
VLITPPPTPNGRLHIGHVAGPFLRADLLRRLIRFVGRDDVLHLSHIDGYQSYVPKKARELQRPSHDFCGEMSQGIRDDFASFAIGFDYFADNTAPAYVEFLESAVEHMMSRLEPRARQARLCDACQAPLFEAHVKGHCRHCFHDCYQNVCENCCHPQSPESLLEARCCQCGSDRVQDATDRQELWLTLSEADVEAARRVMNALVAGNRRHKALFDELGAHEIALAYSTDYGIFPRALAPLALNAWVEIYFAHLWSLFQSLGIETRHGFEHALRELRKSSFQPRVAYLFGIDNSYYYAFLFTWLSLRLDIPEMLPQAILANFFLQLNDAKVSSSRNNVIWAKELLGEAPLETLRGTLAASCPEFAPRNYQSNPLQLPHLPEPERKAVLSQASSPAYRILGERIESLADPRRFSVEGLLNAMQKWGTYAQTTRRDRQADRSSVEVDAYLSALAESLAMA